MSRRLLTASTMTALVVIVVVMAVWGFKSLTEPLPGSSATTTTDTSTCTKAETAVKKFVFRRDVKVSVFNAGGRTGEAGDALVKLEDAGFQPGDVANAPSGVSIPRAVVWTTKRDDAAARLVAANLGPHTKVVVTSRDLGAGIDVLVGPKFHGLDPKAPHSLKLPRPEKTCVKVS